MTKIQGDRDSAFTYTGHFWHGQSGLNLTLYRAYDSVLGRWLSRDPIAENGGINMYAYVQNSPILAVDPLGLDMWVEGPIHNDRFLHLKICIGQPCGSYTCFTYIMNFFPDKSFGRGFPIIDTDHGGDIQSGGYFPSTPIEDQKMSMEMFNFVTSPDSMGVYPYHNCRNWSWWWFNHFKKKLNKTPVAPPNRPRHSCEKCPNLPGPFTPLTSFF